MARRSRKAPSETAVYDLLWAMMADPKLKAPAKCVGVALALKFRNVQTGQCNPSFATLAKVVGRERRSVIEAVTELKEAGWVWWEATGGGSKANTNKFTFPRLTGVELDTRTGAEVDTGAELGTTGVEFSTSGVSNSAHELSIEPLKNLSAEAQRSEGSALPAWAKPAGKGKYFVEVESPGGDLIRRYHQAIGQKLPIVSQRQNAFIVPYVTPPGAAPVAA